MVCDMERTPIYAQIDRADKEWLATVSREAGMSMAAGLRAILTEARTSGVSLKVLGQVIRP